MTENATICVVDDDDGVREAIRALLACEGFDVAAFASGVDFLRDARLNSLSCLVLDVHMPGMSGFELLDRIRSSRMGIPAVVITGRPDPAVRSAADRAGVALLRKPFAADELVQSIKEALRGHPAIKLELAPNAGEFDSSLS